LGGKNLMRVSTPRLRVLIVGAGVAGLQAMLAIDALARERVAVTILDPSDAYVDRTMSFAEPYGSGPPERLPLARLCAEAHAQHVRARLVSVDPERRTAITDVEGEHGYDALILATGCRAVSVYGRGVTFEPAHPQGMTWTLHDLDVGHADRVAVVVPPGPHWTLPAYELAMMVARHATVMGRRGLTIMLLVPEPEPLGIFGRDVSDHVGHELTCAGVHLVVSAFVDVLGGTDATSVLRFSGHELEVDRVIALPRLVPYVLPGLGSDFLAVDAFGRVADRPGIYAAGDVANHPIKQGGLAAQQAESVATDVARVAGADVLPKAATSVLRARLRTGDGDRFLLNDPALEPAGRWSEHPLWAPPGKIANTRLASLLATRQSRLVPASA
jgi:NADPH-dependent 2,4-dienoyl-CoA reductase/sulfur reductase-like enzyme